jgi:Na+/H+-dicarboxylate symporter
MFFFNQKADENVIDYWYAVPSERNGINVLGLVMFCFVFGYVISKMNANGKVLLSFFEAINDASVKMIGIVML